MKADGSQASSSRPLAALDELKRWGLADFRVAIQEQQKYGFDDGHRSSLPRVQINAWRDSYVGMSRFVFRFVLLSRTCLVGQQPF